MSLVRQPVDASPRRLPDSGRRVGSHSGFPLLGITLFGLPFLAAGLLIMGTGLGIVPVNPRKVHAPYWVLTAIGITFAMVGVMMLGMAFRQWLAGTRTTRGRSGAAGRALADHDWHPDGTRSRLGWHAFVGVAGTLVLALFLAPFNYWAFLSDDGNVVITLVVGLFDLILVAALIECAMRIGRALKFGGSRVRPMAFPLAPGEPKGLRWFPPRGIATANRGHFALRCVEEWIESTGSGRNRSQRIVHEVQWEERFTLAAPLRFTPGVPVTLTFSPAPEAPGSSLSAPRPVFWELDVNLSLPGLDFVETYLVPVYA